MELIFIARKRDGLVLCESWDDRNREELMSYKIQAKRLLKKIGMNNSTLSPRCSFDSDNHTFHCYIVDGTIFMALCEKAFSKKLAFSFLDEISKAFEEELKKEWGATHAADYRSLMETIEKPYYFITFDRHIQRMLNDFRDPQSSTALQKLNENLIEVTSIMRSNINDILQRGEQIEDVTRKAQDLRFHSKKFAETAKVLSWNALFYKYLPYGVLLGIMIIILLSYFWRFTT